MPPGKVFTQITKGWIHAANQREFLLAAPALQLLLPADGISHIAEGFAINQPEKFVLLCEARTQLLFVFKRAAFEVVCNPGVKDARCACKNVDVVDGHVRGFWHEQIAVVTQEGSKGWVWAELPSTQKR